MRFFRRVSYFVVMIAVFQDECLQAKFTTASINYFTGSMLKDATRLRSTERVSLTVGGKHMDHEGHKYHEGAWFRIPLLNLSVIWVRNVTPLTADIELRRMRRCLTTATQYSL